MPPIIATDKLTKDYGPVKALDGLSVAVEPGIVGLVGANGAGKSTLIKLLLGLIPASGGAASVMGMDVAARAPEIRQYVGYMPEHDCLPPDVGATDFVTHMARISGLPASSARERTAEVLRHVGLYEERYRQMGGYSTGMKQRVKLAQALVADPRLLLLDEPTNGLDPAGRDEMLDLIKRTGSEFGIAVLVASHLLGEIERVCDYLVAIDAGRLLQAAPLSTFTQRTPVVAVEVEDDAAVLAATLATRGLHVRADERIVFVELSSDAVYDAIRDAAADHEIAVVRIQQERRRLEELFRDSAEPAPAVPPPPPAPRAEGPFAGSVR